MSLESYTNKNVYVASSWRNDYQPAVVALLRGMGFNTYDFKNPPGSTGFAWSSIDEDWEDWDTVDFIKALQHPKADAGFNSDFQGLAAADLCVLVLPCGRSAHIEAGWLAGQGKNVIVYSPIPQEPELMYKLCYCVCADIKGLYNVLLRLK